MFSVVQQTSLRYVVSSFSPFTRVEASVQLRTRKKIGCNGSEGDNEGSLSVKQTHSVPYGAPVSCGMLTATTPLLTWCHSAQLRRPLPSRMFTVTIILFASRPVSTKIHTFVSALHAHPTQREAPLYTTGSPSRALRKCT